MASAFPPRYPRPGVTDPASFGSLFDRGFLVPPAVETWPLEKSAEAYQTVLDGSAGIKQVLLPTGGGA